MTVIILSVMETIIINPVPAYTGLSTAALGLKTVDLRQVPALFQSVFTSYHIFRPSIYVKHPHLSSFQFVLFLGYSGGGFS